jgi:hypothetical protein
MRRRSLPRPNHLPVRVSYYFLGTYEAAGYFLGTYEAAGTTKYGRTALGYGVPRGIRTPVASVKGMCPRPLDDGAAGLKSTDGAYESWRASKRRPLAWQASALLSHPRPHVEAGDLTLRGAFRQGIAGAAGRYSRSLKSDD